MTKTKIAVMIDLEDECPARADWISELAAPAVGAQPVTVRLYKGEVLNVPQSTSAPTIPPANWAIQ